MQIDYDGIKYEVDYLINKDASNMIRCLMEEMEEGHLPYWNPVYSWEICDVCHGEGSHSRRLGVIDRDDWTDDDFYDYMEGHYDDVCEKCNGSGKVKDIDWGSAPGEIVKWVDEYERESYETAMIYRSERMMGA